MEHKLSRSSSDSILAGVCGGLGRYLAINTDLVRVFIIFLSVFSGLGILIYFLLWILVPREDLSGNTSSLPSDRTHQFRDEIVELTHHPNPRAFTWIGIALIVAGAAAFIQALGLPFLSWLNSTVIWSLALVIVGAVLVYRALKG